MTRLINLVMILFFGLMWFPLLKLLAGEELKKKIRINDGEHSVWGK